MTARDYLGGGEVGPAGAEMVFDVLVDPVADGSNPRQTVCGLPEFFPSKIKELVGIAITAWQSVAQDFGREFPTGSMGPDISRLSGNEETATRASCLISLRPGMSMARHARLPWLS
jgi:hypothetical protein